VNVVTSSEVWPSGNRIFTSLDELAVRYATRLTDRSEPYAGLQIDDGHGGDVSLTVLLLDGTLRLTAHDVVSDLDEDAINFVNRSLPLVRAFRGDSESVELGIGTYWAGRIPGADDLGMLIGHLAAAQRWVRHGGDPPDLPLLDSRRNGGGLSAAHDDVLERYHVSASVAGGWVSVRASRLRPMTLTTSWSRTVDRLQSWTRAGKYVVSIDKELFAESVNVAADADVGQWSVSQVTLMLQVAERHLGR
jgi:hypothetical protein